LDLFTEAGPKFNVNDCRELVTVGDRDVRLLRRRKEVEAALNEALTEEPPPALHELARRMGYRSTSWFYGINLPLCKQITTNNQKWKRKQLNRKQVRICTGLDEIKAALESALAQEQAISVSEVATNMGYVNCTYVRKKFPELCGTISRRFADQRRARVESVLLDALEEDPPPTIHKIVRQARSNTIALRKAFPHLWDRLCARRKSFQEQWAAELRQSLEEALRENPAPSIRTVCLRLDLHPVMLGKTFPYLRAAISARYEQAKIETAKMRRERLREEVRQIIVELYRKGVYPSLDRIWTSLSENSLSNWAVIIRTWKQAKLELGIDRARINACS
jgi:DNA-binding transcriptional MerR regulator